MTTSEPLIPKHGGYRNLKSFQVAQLVYDVTVRFCDRYIDRRSRTVDQMVQAAPSAACRTSPKAARLQRHVQERPNSSSPTWRVPAWKSCDWTTRISCANATCRCGSVMTRGGRA